MTNPRQENSWPPGKAVPVWLLVTILVTFVLGFILGLIAVNFLSDNQMRCSTASIGSFVCTGAVGAAAIILAGITIVLSRSAEDALVKRSDEGIRLQNEVFVRTSEVLSKIQASTGVTEKRLEDIISGRTAVIAEKTFEKSFPSGEGELSKESEDRLKKSLAESLKEELLPLISHPAQWEHRLTDYEANMRRSAEEIQGNWKKFRGAVVAEITKKPNVALVSQAQGDLRAGTMEKFWDAVFEVDGHRFGLDIHTQEQISEAGGLHGWVVSAESRNRVARAVTWRAWEDKITKVFLVWDNDMASTPAIAELLKTISRGARDAEFELVAGSPPEVAKEVLSRFDQELTDESQQKPEAQPEDTDDKE